MSKIIVFHCAVKAVNSQIYELPITLLLHQTFVNLKKKTQINHSWR